MTTCKIDGCCAGGKLRLGLCVKHYTRLRRYGDPERERPTLSERFHAGYLIDDCSGCWLWQKAIGGTGYGAIQLAAGVTGKAHRVSWELANGPVPTGLNVLHECDTPRCVNPKHLFVGTVADNSNDMVSKGRSLVGAKNPNARLKEDDIQMILSSSLNAIQLGELLSVNPETIRRVRRGEHWRSDVERTRAIYKRMTFA